MADRLSALAGHTHPGRHGAGDQPGVSFVERRGLSMAQLAAFPEDLEAVRTAVREAFALDLPAAGLAGEASGVTALNLAPEKWLLVGAEAVQVADKLVSTFAERPTVAVTDLSHARTVIRASGGRVRDLLAKDTPLDFNPAGFRPGEVKSSRFSHIAVTLHCVEDNAFDLYAFRSFGLALWEDLTDQAGDLGYEVLTA